jgi:hypothetical protein
VTDNSIAYGQLLAYIDDLNAGVSALALTIEKQMRDCRYKPIERAGSQVYWYLNSRIDRPNGWRLKMVTRLLTPDNCIDDAFRTDHSLLYQILIDSQSAFDFPTILCARLEHPDMSGSEIYSAIWNSDLFAALHCESSSWTCFSEENGWCLAKPAIKSPLKSIKGYILNLVDITSARDVTERIVEPLLRSGDPGYRLCVEHLPFPGLASR